MDLFTKLHFESINFLFRNGELGILFLLKERMDGANTYSKTQSV